MSRKERKKVDLFFDEDGTCLTCDGTGKSLGYSICYACLGAGSSNEMLNLSTQIKLERITQLEQEAEQRYMIESGNVLTPREIRLMETLKRDRETGKIDPPLPTD